MARSHDNRLRNRTELLAHRKNQRELGYDFALSATCLGLPEEEWIKARLTRISLRDAASIDQIPTHLQDIVNRGLQELEVTQKKIQDEGVTEPETLQDRARNNEHVKAAARAYCLATFIDPPLVERTEDLQKPGNEDAWVVDDVDADDQNAIFFGNLDADSSAAKKFRIHRPQSVIDVGHSPARPVATETARDPGLAVVGRDAPTVTGL